MLLINDLKYIQNEFHGQRLRANRHWLNERALFKPVAIVQPAANSGDAEHHPGVAHRQLGKRIDDDVSAMMSEDSAAAASGSMVSSHVALRPVLIVAQIFAVMPLYGICTDHAAQLRFVWLSVRMLHSVCVLAAVAFMAVVSIVWGASGPTSVRRLEPIIWWLSKFIIMINFTMVARRWPRLMTFWEWVEGRLPDYVGAEAAAAAAAPDTGRNWFFQRRIKWYTISISFIIFVEHSMSIAAGVYGGTLCRNTTAMEGYIRTAYPQLYEQLEWRPTSGSRADWSTHLVALLAVEYINYYCVFLWTFMDIFIVAICLCLTRRYGALNEELERNRGLAMPSKFWAEQRRSFASLHQLICQIDDSIAIITTFSVSNNLYFILIQLLYSFHPKESYVHSIYFWSSLSFLIARTLFVTLHAAQLNDESKRAADVLREIPTDHYHLEAQRFLEQVCNTEVAFSGMRFFHLNRSLILSMAGTVVTYELVLVQFQVLYVDAPKIDC